MSEPAGAVPARKPKSERRQRGVVISVRFTPGELFAVQARTGGAPVSTFLRELALAEPAVPAEAPRVTAIRIAREFHETYERLAPSAGYETRPESRCPWDEVPVVNRALMANVVQDLLSRGVIKS